MNVSMSFDVGQLQPGACINVNGVNEPYKRIVCMHMMRESGQI